MLACVLALFLLLPVSGTPFGNHSDQEVDLRASNSHGLVSLMWPFSKTRNLLVTVRFSLLCFKTGGVK